LPASAPRPAPREHVCFVAPNAWLVFSGQTEVPFAGGAELQQAILARLLAAEGYRVSIITQDFGQPDGLEIDGVVVRKVFRGRDGVPVLRFVHPRLTRMWRALHEVDADIYYYRSASMWVGVLAEFCRRKNKRLIYAGASDPDFEPDIGGQIRYARDRWLFRRGVARAHALIAQNQAQVRSARAWYGREAVYIPSCYTLPAPARGPACAGAQGDRVLWVATLRATKRPELFLELARRLPDWRFTMVGGPAPEDPALFERIAAQAKCVPNLEFTGFLPLAETEKWFDRARVLVNTSVYEGMPNTFLQAWARGVPTVATVDVGTVASRKVDDLQGLARELEGLLSDARAWREASLRCREHFARTHSAREVLARYVRVLEQLMADRHRRA
jgi:glycosyltransferase involved in cell wall biosynthesis